MEDAWLPIVEHDTFEQVQAILKKRAFITLHPKRVASHYLLSGIAKCGHCRKMELADMHTVTHCVEDLRNMLCHSSVTENKAFIQSFIREIKVMGKKVTIRYSMPAQCGLVTERATIVPPIVRCGGRYCTIDRTRNFDLAFRLT